MLLPIVTRPSTSLCSRACNFLVVISFCLGLSGLAVGLARAEDGLQPGEGYVTRFSGTTTESGKAVIDTGGTVGSIVDLRSPAQPPRGQHWLNEPQRNPVTAGDVGQVFGIALDEAVAPNVYLTATSAFGLHRTADNADWMAGMWGPSASPGAVWKLDATDDYRPSLFATIALDGRLNTGAALGNIAYDKWNEQLFVSDLETGMIHRLGLDGADLGYFDHGTTGRAAFLDVSGGAQSSLPQIAFDPNSAARIKDCPGGDFVKTPDCWHFADFRRRVWGVGVRQNAETEEVRLYYAVWSSQALGSKDFASASDDEKRNSLWSVAIGKDGSFDAKSVRREFFLPDFFVDPADIARAGKSNPVSDIAFPDCAEQNVMLLAERGGVRNLGLDVEEPFATPHEARVLRYELDDKGAWQLQGRYDVGFYDRKTDREPFVRANSSGGVDFDYGYSIEWTIDLEKPDQFVWMTGDSLCSPLAPCFVPDSGFLEDGSHVHGAQGTPEFAYEELLPAAAMQPYPTAGEAYPANGPLQSWMIDADINVDASGKVIMESLTKNDATKIGDIEIYELCAAEGEAPPVEGQELEVVEPPIVELPPEVEEPPIIELPPIDEGPDLEKTKTGPAECVEGDICTFTITITNNGPGTWDGPLWEVDTLPPGAILWDYAPQPDWICNQAGQAVFCTNLWVTLAPGDFVTLTIDVLLPFGIAGQVIENCIADIWLPSTDVDDPAVIWAIEQALAALGYVVGPIDGVLDIVTMNAIAQFQFDNGLPVTWLPDQALLDLLFGGTAAAMGDADPDNDWSCAQVPIVAPAAPIQGDEPDLAVRKQQLARQCLPGELCSFELRFLNRGPGDWTGFPSIVDTVPAGATLVANSAWFCAQDGDQVSCQSPLEVTLVPNEARTIVLTVRMPGDLRAGAENCVEIDWPAGAERDPNADNDRDCDPIDVGRELVPDLLVRKMQLGAPCLPGESCSFELWLINRGPVSWTGIPRLQDELPSGAVLKDGSGCRQSGTLVTCTGKQLTLPPGKGTRVTVIVTLPQDLEPGTKNCGRIQRAPGTPRDPIPQNDQHCIPIIVATPTPPAPPEPSAPPPDTSIEKIQIGNCRAGGVCMFELKFINNGPGDWSGTPTVSELMPPGAKVSDTHPSTWSCGEGAGKYTCEHASATMTQGAHISLIISMMVPVTTTSGAENCAVLEPPAEGPTDPHADNDKICVPVEVVPTPIYKPHPPTPVEPPPPPTHVTPPTIIIPAPPIRPPKTGCPPGTRLEGHHCVKPCPPGTIKRGGVCLVPGIKVKPPHGGIRIKPPYDHPKVKPPYGHPKVKPPYDHPKVKPPYDGHGKSKVKPPYDGHGKSKVKPPSHGKSKVKPPSHGKSKVKRPSSQGKSKAPGKSGGKKGDGKKGKKDRKH
ncbi:MAG TPA: peptidoglycan-binding protein [Alphaproteobacteria bacterium]|nr:peptidoglycan-binding protein [Alphaproteobacteria bacterium]